MNGKLLGAMTALIFLSGIAVSAAQERRPSLDTRFEPLSAVKDTTAGMVGRLVAEMVRTTPGFVNAAAMNDMYEVSAGRIALERSRSPAVRAFARKMIDAHTVSTARLKRTIRNYNINATLPERVDARRRGMLDDLRGARPRNFDHRYIAQQIAAHKEADILMRRYARSGKINAMRDFASTTGKTVATHLAMAEKLDPTTRNAGR